MNSRFVLLVFLVVLISCRDKDKNGKALDTPTTGSVKVAVDASLQPLGEAEVEGFEALYKYADIQPIYLSEAKAVDALLSDSVRLIVITRGLKPDEQAVLERQKLVARDLTVAKEGVAVIIHPDNPDSTIRMGEIRQVLEGSVDSWKQLDPVSPLGKLQVVFGQPDAGIVRFLRDSVLAFGKLPPFFFAVDSDSAVVNYVAQNKEAMGMIGASWISDSDDATVNKFMESIRVMAVAEGNDDPCQPYQAYIARGDYPMTRDVVMISREARAGLATGFMAFVAGDKGQRIVLKAGLVPATMPIRIVEVNHEPL